jgi:hypothetical protein
VTAVVGVVVLGAEFGDGLGVAEGGGEFTAFPVTALERSTGAMLSNSSVIPFGSIGRFEDLASAWSASAPLRATDPFLGKLVV